MLGVSWAPRIMLFTKQLPCSCETYILVGDKETKHLSEQQSVGLGMLRCGGVDGELKLLSFKRRLGRDGICDR